MSTLGDQLLRIQTYADILGGPFGVSNDGGNQRSSNHSNGANPMELQSLKNMRTRDKH